MKVSRKTEYALRCVWRLALDEGRTVTLAELAETTAAPVAFLAKLLQGLCAAGVVASHRGVKGGFRLARPARETSLYEVYVAMEGRRAAREQCAVSPNICGVDGYCAVHPYWSKARREFETSLRRARAGDAVAAFPLPSARTAAGSRTSDPQQSPSE